MQQIVSGGTYSCEWDNEENRIRWVKVAFKEAIGYACTDLIVSIARQPLLSIQPLHRIQHHQPQVNPALIAHKLFDSAGL